MPPLSVQLFVPEDDGADTLSDEDLLLPEFVPAAFKMRASPAVPPIRARHIPGIPARPAGPTGAALAPGPCGEAPRGPEVAADGSDDLPARRRMPLPRSGWMERGGNPKGGRRTGL